MRNIIAEMNKNVHSHVRSQKWHNTKSIGGYNELI
jgi:hypothetical protein